MDVFRSSTTVCRGSKDDCVNSFKLRYVCRCILGNPSSCVCVLCVCVCLPCSKMADADSIHLPPNADWCRRLTLIHQSQAATRPINRPADSLRQRAVASPAPVPVVFEILETLSICEALDCNPVCNLFKVHSHTL